MSSTPWLKFYPRDWRGDQALRACSVAARGLWMECLCIMHEAKPYGHLLLNGSPVGDDTLARMAGTSVDEVQALMAELRQAGVFSVTREGVVLSRRMTKDFGKAQKGAKAAKKRWSQVAGTTTENAPPNGSPIENPHTQIPEARDQRPEEPSSLRSDGKSARKRASRADDLKDFEQELAELDRERLDALIKLRRKKNGQITGYAARLFAQDAAACGLSLAGAVDTCISRNWITVKPDWLQRGGGRLHVVGAIASEQVNDDEWRKRVDRFVRTRKWSDDRAWGQPPGKPDCKVPAHILEEFRKKASNE